VTARLPLLIFPFNGNGVEALDALGDAWELVAFVDDTPAKQGLQPQGWRVMGRDALSAWPQARVLAVPGGPASFRERLRVIDSLGVPADRFARVIHPAASVGARVQLGCNVLLMAGVVITSNAVVEDHVCVLPNTVIHHDVVVGRGSLVGSNVTLAGSVRVGANCYIGSGSSVMNGLTLGAATLVGLGSTVIRDTTPGSRVVGCPARPLP
jgi:sugar O-acyltransferase (sialic acid O-acetyltransferase NeuD family)